MLVLTTGIHRLVTAQKHQTYVMHEKVLVLL
jgi:hypothetical protein